MYVERIPNRNSNPTWLIRESKWVDGNVQKTTLANLTKLPMQVIKGIQILLKGGTAVQSVHDAFDIQSSKQHGQVAAVLGIMNQLELPKLIAPKHTRFRRLILGMIAARVIQPKSKLATSAMLDVHTATTTLNEELGLKRVDEDDLYDAMDELLKRKTEIECRLAKRHLNSGGLVLYDVTSSYVEGEKNEWAAYGTNRDKKKGKKQIVFGLMTDQEGTPVSVEVFCGNTADTATLPTQLEKIQNTFGLQQAVLVGDRGILKQKQIDELPVGLDWITAMQKSEIREVVEQEGLQMSLFDEQDLVEVFSDLYPKERLVLCRNPLQAAKNQQTRDELLIKTEQKLNQIVEATQQGRLKDKGKIGRRVGKWVNKYKMKKYFTLDIREGHFSYTRNAQTIARAEQLDGLYAIRSSLNPEPQASELVAHYKQLSTVEMAFRTMKSMSVQVRPIHHRTKDRVVAHVFLCMLAYYVEFHLRRKWAPLLFAEDTPAPRTSVVQPVSPSEPAKKKARTKRTQDGEKVRNFAGLMEELSKLSRLTVLPKISTNTTPEIVMIKDVSATQKRAFKLLNLKPL
ncbi:MAG: IS1634 family transposase [Rhodothermaceae bacterium]|nr:IS1634 family transposase [Rhodothermaceae bacterium]